MTDRREHRKSQSIDKWLDGQMDDKDMEVMKNRHTDG